MQFGNNQAIQTFLNCIAAIIQFYIRDLSISKQVSIFLRVVADTVTFFKRFFVDIVPLVSTYVRPIGNVRRSIYR